MLIDVDDVVTTELHVLTAAESSTVFDVSSEVDCTLSDLVVELEPGVEVVDVRWLDVVLGGTVNEDDEESLV